MNTTSASPTPQQELKAVTSNLISASAGTGKTYQLASRFVALLALGYKAEEMIALTFTRKAAGEFRNRILKALSDGALDLDEKGHPRQTDANGVLQGRNGMTARVWETWTGLTIKDGRVAPAGNPVALCPDCVCVMEAAAAAGKTPEQIYAQDDALYARLGLPRLTRESYREMLAAIVKVLSRLSLSTLDSFFNRIVRGNSLSIGLRKIIPIEPEDAEAERLAVLRELISGMNSEDAKGHEFLQQYEKLTQGKGRKMMEFLGEQIKNYLSLYRSIHTVSAWGNAEAFSLIPKDIKDTITPEQWVLYEAKLLSHYSDLVRCESKSAKTANAAVQALLKDLKKGSFSFLHKHVDPTKNNTGSKFNKFYEKAAGKAEQELAKAMKKIIDEVRDAYLRAVINKTRSLLYVLHHFAGAYLRHTRHTGKVGFDDIAMFAYHLMMKSEQPGNDRSRSYAAERIRYNLDTTFKHWMLDEFQDTSETQFATLAPILTEIAQCERKEDTRTAERSLFVVGDEKQSIYGFRTGETEVFRKLQTEQPWKHVLTPSELKKSYRSSPEIMGEHGFINKMFRALNEVEKSITAEDNEELKKLGNNQLTVYDDRLLKSFSHHRSATKKAGYVRICAVPEQENSEETRLAFYDAIARLLREELTDENSAPRNGMSIAILTRNNNEGAELEAKLKEKLPKLPVMRLGNDKIAATSQMGEILLSFFLWLLHPDDAYRAGLVKASPLSRLFLSPAAEESAPRKNKLYKQAQFRHTRNHWLQQLENHGYAATVRTLLNCFPTEPQNLREGRTAQIWITEAHAFDCTGGTPEEWIARIGKAGEAAAGSSRYVQIMTMHKSKGLEFDAVILPYISADAEDELSDVSYFSLKDTHGNINAMLLNPGGAEKRDAWKEVFDPLCAAKKQHSRKEAYNLLYVAATRAKHADYIFCHGYSLVEADKKTLKGRARSTGGLIRRMLETPEFRTDDPEPKNFCQSIEKATILWESDAANARWFEHPGFVHDNQPHSETAPPLTLPEIARCRRRRISPSALAKAEDNPRLEQENQTAPRRYLNDSAAEFGTAVHECWEQISWLNDGSPLPAWLNAPSTDAQKVVQEALAQRDVRELFTAKPGDTVYNEQSIEAITANNLWVSGTIDRLILTGSAAAPTAAHIIDFKTNRLVPDETEKDAYKVLKSKYTEQMTAYRQLICDAFGLPAAAVSVSLISCPIHAPAQVIPYSNEELPIKASAE